MNAHPILDKLRTALPALTERAALLDADAAFPDREIALLHEIGLLAAPAPRAMGGLGLGTDPIAADATLAAFRLLGQANLALGRLLEAHVNAWRLLVRYGHPALIDAAADDSTGGLLVGLWVTDPPGGGLRDNRDGTVSGVKQFCSGAGHVTRAVVTVEDEAGGTSLAYVRLDATVTARPLPGGLAGMRAATTGEMRFDHTPAALFGAAGDYLREPDFSCGAWRTSAATLGGMDSLLDQFRIGLTTRKRDGDPHQRARYGQAVMAVETAALWMGQAAERAEAPGAGADAIAYVGLARLAVERAALELITLVQRSLGTAALLRGQPAERITRDLATYLRQPAADDVLTEAAGRFLGPA